MIMSIRSSGAWTTASSRMRLVHESLAVGDRLPGQAQLQVAVVPGDHADRADHVVDRLGARAEHLRVHGREVVLAVDPLGDDQRRGQDRLQRGAVGVGAGS